MINRRIRSALLGFITLFLPMALWAEPQQLVFSHVVSPDTPKGKMAKMFKSMVEKKMGDRFEIIIYPSADLMDDDEAVNAIAEGRIHFAAPSLSKFETYTQKLKVFDLPFLFPDMDAVNRFQNSPTGQSLLTSMENQGILGLGYLHNGLKQLTADRPFTRPEDLAGLRFRTMNSDVLIKQFELLNAEAVPMAFSEVYQALAVKRINGQENTWSNIFSKAFYEHQPYMMISNHGVLDYMLITNTDFWKGLSEQDRFNFRYAIKMALKYGNAVAKAKSTNDKTELTHMKNVTVYEPTAAELATWQNAMQPLWASYEKIIGKNIIDAARKAGQP
ncbi:DctP family TRAP transporter solute-binding subunit [Marinobacter sp.]|uniref:DctP family TRAP transporter solute-binding subunit n=1 Tax=Marinobacter sp. TaxID=50741 RepID=UPI00356B5CDF